MVREPLSELPTVFLRGLMNVLFRWAQTGLCFWSSWLPPFICTLTLFQAAAGPKPPLQPQPSF